MSKFLIVVMVLAAVGMIFGLSKQKAGYMWGKTMAVACAALALLAAISHIFASRGPSTTEIIGREMAYQEVGGRKLGMHLAATYPGSKAIIIVQPTMGAAASRPDALVEGLKRGLGNRVAVVAEIAPDIGEEAKKMFMAEMGPMPSGGEGQDMPMEMMPPLEYWYTAEVFDKIAAEYVDKADLIITTIGLPQDLRSMSFWAMERRPKLAISNGAVYELRKAIEQQFVVAAVTYSPKAVYDQKAVPSNMEEAFAKRYLLVTPENVAQTAAEYGDLFMRE